MSSGITKPGYHYVAYVDESGDPGLKRIRPLDPTDSSEWLIVAGVVIDASREHKVPSWIKNALIALKSRQLKDIHFAKLNDTRRVIMCDQVASHPLRFVVASNKKNMRGYHNPDAAKVPSDN